MPEFGGPKKESRPVPKPEEMEAQFMEVAKAHPGMFIFKQKGDS